MLTNEGLSNRPAALLLWPHASTQGVADASALCGSGSFQATRSGVLGTCRGPATLGGGGKSRLPCPRKWAWLVVIASSRANVCMLFVSLRQVLKRVVQRSAGVRPWPTSTVRLCRARACKFFWEVMSMPLPQHAMPSSRDRTPSSRRAPSAIRLLPPLDVSASGAGERSDALSCVAFCAMLSRPVVYMSVPSSCDLASPWRGMVRSCFLNPLWRMWRETCVTLCL